MAASVLQRFYTTNDSIFEFNLKYLFLVGLWPENNLTEKQKVVYKIYAAILHILTIFLIIITGVGTYNSKNNLNIFLTNLDKTLCVYNFFFKTIIFLINRDKLKTLIEEIENSGDVVTDQTKRLMAIFVFIITSSSLLVVGSFSALAIYEGNMTIEAWMPFDSLENKKTLILSAQILAFTFLPGMFRAYAMQGLVCSLMMYLCEQLTDLQNKIKDLRYTKENAMDIRKKFKHAIKKHVRLMRYSKTMENIFKEYFLVQNLAFTLELCLNAIMVTVVKDITLIATFLAYLAIALLNAYIYSYLGNELIIQSERIALAGYETPWTSWPIDMQKDLLIVIRVAQKPFALSAGRMALLSIQTFSQALYNGYSIFAVLNDIVD